MEGLPYYGVLKLSDDEDHSWTGVWLYETEAEAILEANSFKANDYDGCIKRLVILIRKGESHYTEHYDWRPGLRPDHIPEGLEDFFSGKE